MNNINKYKYLFIYLFIFVQIYKLSFSCYLFKKEFKCRKRLKSSSKMKIIIRSILLYTFFILMLNKMIKIIF